MRRIRRIAIGCLLGLCYLLSACSVSAAPAGSSRTAASSRAARTSSVPSSSGRSPGTSEATSLLPEELPTAEAGATAMPGEMRGLWVTYFELGAMFGAPEGFCASFDRLVERAASLGVNALFVHVRSHCDAYYPSDLFPWSKYCTGLKGTQGTDPGLDPLRYMIDATHAKSMAFHAWINPYRVLYDAQDPAELSDDNPAKRWLTDEDTANDTYVRAADGGLYLNPSAEPVQALVVEGVRELVTRYEVDGVHFDDYFYPVKDETFDEREYAAYRAAVRDNPLALADWRRAHVTAMLGRVREVVHTARPATAFGVSPMASIKGNYENVYADVAGWLQAGVVDYLAPQLYFGFDFPDEAYRFGTLVKEWQALATDHGIPLYAGLGAYRIGESAEGHEEWSARHDVLARQVACLRQAGWQGYILYSYSTLFVDDDAHAAEQAALLKEIGS